jgi:hypothetical protein
LIDDLIGKPTGTVFASSIVQLRCKRAGYSSGLFAPTLGGTHRVITSPCAPAAEENLLFRRARTILTNAEADRRMTTDQQKQVIDALTIAASELDRSSETKPLADQVRGLKGKAHLQAGDLRPLLGNMQSQIDLQQSRAQRCYWETVAR